MWEEQGNVPEAPLFSSLKAHFHPLGSFATWKSIFFSHFLSGKSSPVERYPANKTNLDDDDEPHYVDVHALFLFFSFLGPPSFIRGCPLSSRLISLFGQCVVSDVLPNSLAAGKMSQIIFCLFIFWERSRPKWRQKGKSFGSNVKENEDIAGVDGGGGSGGGDFSPEKKWPGFKMIRSTRRVIKASFGLFSFMTGD